MKFITLIGSTLLVIATSNAAIISPEQVSQFPDFAPTQNDMDQFNCRPEKGTIKPMMNCIIQDLSPDNNISILVGDAVGFYEPYQNKEMPPPVMKRAEFMRRGIEFLDMASRSSEEAKQIRMDICTVFKRAMACRTPQENNCGQLLDHMIEKNKDKIRELISSYLDVDVSDEEISQILNYQHIQQVQAKIMCLMCANEQEVLKEVLQGISMTIKNRGESIRLKYQRVPELLMGCGVMPKEQNMPPPALISIIKNPCTMKDTAECLADGFYKLFFNAESDAAEDFVDLVFANAFDFMKCGTTEPGEANCDIVRKLNAGGGTILV